VSNIADLRRDYTQFGMLETDVDRDPLRQFQDWFDTSIAANIIEPNAMTLATVTPDGKPDARIVLLKGLDARGFIFYTNFLSRKGKELEVNPQATLVFLWAELERQVRVEGVVERVSNEEADVYFHSRPLGSQLGAWASNQSEIISDRAYLEKRHEELAKEYADREIPRPSHWGGYRVIPDSIEFWQGRTSRLHDRLRYDREGDDDNWILRRLAP
jgi:pyridoxamine 5'-phosphate oxidase